MTTKQRASLASVLVVVALSVGCYGAPKGSGKLDILLANEGPAAAKPEAATENDEGIREWGLGHWGLAEEHFKKATEIDPKYATGFFNIGVARDQLGRHMEAAEAFKQAKALASDAPRIAEAEILKRHLKGM